MATSIEKLAQSLYTKQHKKIIGVGRNFLSHKKEIHRVTNPNPLLFDKPLSSIITSGSTMRIPKNNHLVHEVELGIVIAMKGKNLKPSDFNAYVEGYFLGLDIFDTKMKDIAIRDSAPWTISKGSDNMFCVSEMIPRDQIGNHHNLELSLTVNGVER